jgi:hypothetical protein
MPCHPPRYATISVPFCKTDAQEVIVECAPKPRTNLTRVQGPGSRMSGLARNQIGRLLTFVRRIQASYKALVFRRGRDRDQP